MADADCELYQLTCHAKNFFGGAISAASDSVVDSWAEATLKGLDRTMAGVGTFWVKVKTPDVSGPGSTVEWIQAMTSWMVLVAGVFSFIISCGILVWNQRGETIRSMLKGMFNLLFISAAATTIGHESITICDETASWLVERASGSLDGSFTKTLLVVTAIDIGATTKIVVIVLGLAGLFANLLQMGMMYVRAAMLIFLLVVIPIAAALSMLGWGQVWLNKLSAWFFGFAASKPAAGLVYAVGIKLISGSSGNDGLQDLMLGIIVIVLAALSLPALIRFVTPAATIGTGGGGAGAGIAGAAALGTGAVAVRDLTSSSSSYASPGPQHAQSTGYGSSTVSAPSGAEGVSGQNGVQGPASSAGPTGAQGAIGPSGATASSGAAGAASGAGASSAAGASAAGSAAAGAATGGISTVIEVGGQAVSATRAVSEQASSSATGAGPEAQA